MQVKVSEKGQVSIPARIRRDLGIAAGDRLEVSLDRESHRIHLEKTASLRSTVLAGSLAKYAQGRRSPTREQIRQAVERGLARDGQAD